MDEATFRLIVKNEKNHWWFQTRKKIIFSAFSKISKLNRGNLKVLDVGCGVGGAIDYLKKYGKVFGVDSSKIAINFCQNKGYYQLIQADVTQLLLPRDSFDLVVALDIIEHVREDKKLISELFQICQKGGWLVISTVAFQSLWSDFDIFSKHLRRYNKKQFFELLKSSGFKIKKITYYNTILFLPIVLSRFINKILRIKLKSENELKRPPLLINFVLKRIFSIEKFWLKKFNFPFGISLFVIAQK